MTEARFFRKLLRGLRAVPRVLVTGKLASYGVAHRRLMRSVEHRRSKYLNNRHLLHAEEYRREMANRFSIWNEVIGLTTAAWTTRADPTVPPQPCTG